MNIVLFNDVTTNESLKELIDEAKKYDGLYVDMSDAKQRKYVKDKASNVSSLIKKLDRVRIDKTKEFKLQIDKEANDIKQQLILANKPFTLLIDEYTEERRRILEEEKRIASIEEMAIKYDSDHEEAISLNRLFDLEYDERKRLKDEEEKRIEAYALFKAKEILKQEEVNRLNEENRINLIKQNDKKHKAIINSNTLNELIDLGFNSETSKELIIVVAKNKLTHVSINY